MPEYYPPKKNGRTSEETKASSSQSAANKGPSYELEGLTAQDAVNKFGPLLT
jgi:hypothetical protein